MSSWAPVLIARWSWTINRAGGSLSAEQLQAGIASLRVPKVWPDCAFSSRSAPNEPSPLGLLGCPHPAATFSFAPCFSLFQIKRQFQNLRTCGFALSFGMGYQDNSICSVQLLVPLAVYLDSIKTGHKERTEMGEKRRYRLCFNLRYLVSSNLLLTSDNSTF